MVSCAECDKQLIIDKLHKHSHESKFLSPGVDVNVCVAMKNDWRRTLALIPIAKM